MLGSVENSLVLLVSAINHFTVVVFMPIAHRFLTISSPYWLGTILPKIKIGQAVFSRKRKSPVAGTGLQIYC